MSNWIPEIMYESDQDGQASSIPFIMVPSDNNMPKLLYIFESRETGNHEPGLEGESVPVVEWDLHQYADMNYLKERVDQDTYDTVRIALGLEKLNIATAKGSEITTSVRKNVESIGEKNSS